MGNRENLVTAPAGPGAEAGGIDHVVVWNSATATDTNLTAEQGIGESTLTTVAVRARAYDTPLEAGRRHYGSWFEVGELTIDNLDELPTAVIDSSSDLLKPFQTISPPPTGNLTIEYTLTDSEEALCTIDAQYRVGGASGTWQAANVGDSQVTKVRATKDGIARTLSWNVLAQFGPVLTNDVEFQIQANDGQNDGPWHRSESFTLDATTLRPNARPSVFYDGAVERVASGTVSIKVGVVDDDQDTVSLTMRYGIGTAAGPPADASFATATLTTAAAFAGTSSGTPTVTIGWNAEKDLGGTAFQDFLYLTINPHDGKEYGTDRLGPVLQFGNDAPLIDSVTVAATDGTASGNIVFHVQVSDSAADATELLSFEFSTKGDFSDTLAVPVTRTYFPVGPLHAGVTAPPPNGNEQRYVWDSRVSTDTASLVAPAAKVQIRLRDSVTGKPGIASNSKVSGPFHLRNNLPPVALVDDIDRGADSVGRIAIGFTLIDADSDPVDAVLQWRAADDVFPDLNQLGDLTDRSFRRAVLRDPAKRRQLQIITDVTTAIEGRAENPSKLKVPLMPNELYAPELLKTPLLGTDVLVGRTIEVLRDRRPTTLLSGLSQPSLVAVEPGGRTALLGLASGDLIRVDLRDRTPLGTVATETVTTGLGHPWDLAIWESPTATTTLAYVVDTVGKRLVEVDLYGGDTRLVADGFLAPRGVAIASARHALVAGETGGGKVYKVDLITGDKVCVLSGLQGPRGLALSRDRQTLFVAEHGGDRIAAFDVVSWVRKRLLPATGEAAPNPSRLAIDSRGRRLVITTDEGSVSKVREIDLGTGRCGVRVPMPDAQLPGYYFAAVALGADGTLLLTATPDLGQSWQLLAGGGGAQERTVVGVAFAPPRITVDRDFNPPLAPPHVWRIPDGRISNGLVALQSSPGGVFHRRVWDTAADHVPQGGARLRLTPYDNAAGQAHTPPFARSVSVFGQLPSATIKPDIPTVLDRPVAIALGDNDGDGDLDIFSANSTSDTLTIFRQQSSGGFPNTPSWTIDQVPPDPDVFDYPVALALGDIDGDGDLDIVSANGGSDTLTVFKAIRSGFADTPSITIDPNNDSVFKSPMALALGDLDGDGDLDIVSANHVSDTLTVFRQDSADFPDTPSETIALPGAFGQAIFDGPRALGLGDIDGDGYLDIVSANDESNTLTIFKQSPGGFLPIQGEVIIPNDTSVFLRPRALELGDVDGDGDLDIVSMNYNSETLTVFRQSSSAFPDAFPDTPSTTIKPDDSYVFWYPSALALGDIDGDGDLDIVSANRNSCSLTVFKQSSGTFPNTPSATIKPGTGSLLWPEALGVGDVDADGDLDIVSASPDSDTLRVFKQSSGGFPNTPRVIIKPDNSSVLEYPRALGLGDIDGDGDLDIVSANHRSNTLTIFKQSSGGFPNTPNTTIKPDDTADFEFPWAVCLGDIDGDGDLDIVSANRDSDTLAVFKQSSGAFPNTPSATIKPNDVAVFNAPHAVALGDVDGDGDLDIVSANPSSSPYLGSLTVFVQDQNGFVDTPSEIIQPTNTSDFDDPWAVCLGDIDGDGDLDIVSANDDSNTLTIFKQGSGGFPLDAPSITIKPENSPVFDGPAALGLGDVDGDGDLDIVSANRRSHTLTVFMQSSGAFDPKIPSATITPGDTSVFAGPRALGLGDIDGDGDLDIVSANPGSQTLTIFEQSSGGFSDTPSITMKPDDSSVFSGPEALGLADIDGDGDLDIVSANQSSHTLTIFQIGPE
ncbi:YncE family protein [Planctomycetota bacterium]